MIDSTNFLLGGLFMLCAAGLASAGIYAYSVYRRQNSRRSHKG